MKDQNPEQERQVATEDPTASREQSQAQQQYEKDQQNRQDSGQQRERSQQEPQQSGQQQMRQEFQPSEQRQPSRTMDHQLTGQNGGLIGGQEMDRYTGQWTSIQAAFVDEPKKAVEQADKLVEEVIQNLSRTFANERQKLEGQWSRGDSVSTEDLRVALQRYRQFFQSLLRT